MRLIVYVALLAALSYAELKVTVSLVPSLIGAPATIALVVASSVLGSWLMRREGRSVWLRFRQAIGSGRVPAREIVDGALVIFGGALLIVPGFVTDAIGAVLLVPVTRPLARWVVERWMTRGLLGVVLGAATRRHARRPADVDGTATEHPAGFDAEPRQLPH